MAPLWLLRVTQPDPPAELFPVPADDFELNDLVMLVIPPSDLTIKVKLGEVGTVIDHEAGHTHRPEVVVDFGRGRVHSMRLRWVMRIESQWSGT